jgi:hypothetical protein
MPNAYIYNCRVALASAPDAYVLQQQTTAASDWSDTAQLMVV